MYKFTIPEQEYELSFSRSGGSGGQNVNKVNTKATLHWNILKSTTLPPVVVERFMKKYGNKLSAEGVLTLSSQAHRTQHDDRAAVARMILQHGRDIPGFGIGKFHRGEIRLASRSVPAGLS